MKTCPKCQQTFPPRLNFCLEDGTVLVERKTNNNEQTQPFSPGPTWELPAQRQTNDENEVVTRIQTERRTLPPDKSSGPNLLLIFAAFFSVGLLIALGIVGYVSFVQHDGPYYPSSRSSPVRTSTPTPAPKTENNLKVEILDKMSDGFGRKYLKCKVTNTSENIVDVSSIGLNFYQGEVKIKDSSSSLELRILKPNQTIPVWISLYDAEKYTSVKVQEPINARPVSKAAGQIYPPLEFSQTEMKAEPGYMMVNFRQYRKIFYKVSGIVENPQDEKISANIYVLFYDEKSEIVGIGKTYLSNLAKGEKTKFEVQEVETDLFGKPKTFEVIAVSN